MYHLVVGVSCGLWGGEALGDSSQPTPAKIQPQIQPSASNMSAGGVHKTSTPSFTQPNGQKNQIIINNTYNYSNEKKKSEKDEKQKNIISDSVKHEIELLVPFCIFIFSKQINNIIGAKNFEILSQKYPNNYKNLNELIEAIDSGSLSKVSKTQAAQAFIQGFGEELKQQASNGSTNLNLKSVIQSAVTKWVNKFKTEIVAEEASADQSTSSQSPTRTPQTPKKSPPDSKSNPNSIKKPKYTPSKSQPASDDPSPDGSESYGEGFLEPKVA